MLQAYPTKGGTGVSIFGDYGDLHALYWTTHTITESLDENAITHKGQFKLLMNFAYQIRKAYSGQRLKKELQFGDEEPVMYYGFELVWTDVLIFISALRCNAGYVQTNRLDQGVLYLLEYVVEKALTDYDPVGAHHIKEFIGHRINIADRYAFHIYQALHLEMVNGKLGKARFRKIPHLLVRFFSNSSLDYKALVASFEKSAIEQSCEPTDLEFDNFPKIKW
jgi:hypothetical protein